ncbi:Acyl-CoA [Boothiomyces macroporosus]|uniref:Acyl-CoA n=1 Tax=Boothiomyces macroporosus TaxID=261099 RepID=A0AAD5UQ46_9FUNG|nr:Acyl-CoA [Boothiomyces macroporosus]
MGQTQSCKRSLTLDPRPDGEKFLLIHDTVYDVTEFVKRHPGGRIIYEQLNPPESGFPADATIAFESLHGHSKKPAQVLKTLKSRKLTQEEKLLRSKSRPFDDDLNKSFQRATQELREIGMFDYSIGHLLWRNVELFGIMFLGGYSVVNYGNFGWWVGAFLFGLFMQRAGWFQHECNHGSASSNQALNDFLGSFWFGFGEAGSAQWWKREHNRHHADPQRHGADIDMNTLPLAVDSITAKKGVKGFLKYQNYLYQAAVWGLVHFWQLYIHPKFMLKKKAYMDLFWTSVHWNLFLGFFIPRIGLFSALALHAVASMVEASLLFTNFALSHTTMPYLEHHDREHWVERSLRRTIDIHGHTKYLGPLLGPIVDSMVNWLMGYLNYQVIHHLWPLMPHKNQANPKVHAIVQRMCDENPGLNMHYNVTNYWTAMYDMYANLTRIARDYGEGVNTNAVHPTKPVWVKGVVAKTANDDLLNAPAA